MPLKFFSSLLEERARNVGKGITIERELLVVQKVSCRTSCSRPCRFSQFPLNHRVIEANTYFENVQAFETVIYLFEKPLEIMIRNTKYSWAAVKFGEKAVMIEKVESIRVVAKYI